MRMLEELINYPIDEHTRIVEISRDFDRCQTMIKARNFALDRSSVFCIDDLSLVHYSGDVKDLVIEKFKRSDLCRPPMYDNEVIPDVCFETRGFSSPSVKTMTNREWLRNRVKEICDCWKN